MAKSAAGKALFALAVAALVVSLAALGYIYSGGGQEAYTGGGDDQANGSPAPGDGGDDDAVELAPDFSYGAVNGGTVSLSGNRGKVVIVDFMATWCQPCKDQIANLKSLQGAYQSDLVIISLNVDQQLSDRELLEYRNLQGAEWGFATDRDGVSLEQEYSVTSIPTIVIIDREGRIALRNVGLMSAPSLESAIEPLL
jgi:thiol-disulfide isomerase/thioredoxin